MGDPLRLTYGHALRAARRAANLTQRELAVRAGLDFTYISKLENDRLPPPAADTVVLLARLVGMSAEAALALAGKLASDVEHQVSVSPAAQEFLREAGEMRLTEKQWRSLRETLKGLSGDGR